MSIQQNYPLEYRNCFGCGVDNENGLRLQGNWDGDDIVTTWHPDPLYQGADNILHGGITALLIDEVCGCAAIAHAHRAAGVALGSRPIVDMVTANINIDYLSPVHMSKPVHLRAKLLDYSGRKMRLECTLLSGDTPAAKASALFVRVKQ